MDTLFWLSLGFVAYVYIGYPVLLDLWARLVGHRRRPGRAAARTAGEPAAAVGPPAPARLRDAAIGDRVPPRVSVIIAARNEAPRLPARLENLLASDYPRERLQIIVASDGSTDGTMGALAPFRGRVDVLLLAPCGKACALNAAVAHARHPVLVFADARQQFAPDAIRRLAAHFTNPSIGAVSGELVLDGGPPTEAGRRRVQAPALRAARVHANEDTPGPVPAQTRGDTAAMTAPASTIGEGVGLYWRYETWLRRREAIVGSTLGVTGAIYAMRRSLWRPLPEGTLLDDVLGPMRLVLDGHRVTFDAEARAYDRTSRDAREEWRRKVRTLAGNFQLLAREPRLLVPVANPVWLQFMSHKIGRLLVPYALVALFVTSLLLAWESALHAAALAGQLAFYALAGYGGLLDWRVRRAAAGWREADREAA